MIVFLENLKKWRNSEILRLFDLRTDIPCSWSGYLNIIKKSVLPKLMYKLKMDPIKILNRFFSIAGQVDTKVHTEKLTYENR